MTEEIYLANRYRLHAQELRSIAACDEHLPTHDTLMRVAKDYERMAETIEAIDSFNRECRTGT